MKINDVKKRNFRGIDFTRVLAAVALSRREKLMVVKVGPIPERNVVIKRFEVHFLNR